MFRSIDSGSVKGFPKGVKEAEAQVRIRLIQCLFSLNCESVSPSSILLSVLVNTLGKVC